MAEGDEKKEKGLSPKQTLFIEAYVGPARFNGTKAAEIAGYKQTPGALRVTATRLLANANIRAEVDARMQAMIMPASEVLNRLGRHASASLADVLTEDGEFDLKEAKRKGNDDLLKKLKVRTSTRHYKDGESEDTTTYEYEIHDPQAALVHLGRYHKLFTDKTEVTGKDGAPLLAEVMVKIDRVYDDSDANRPDRETGDSLA